MDDIGTAIKERIYLILSSVSIMCCRHLWLVTEDHIHVALRDQAHIQPGFA